MLWAGGGVKPRPEATAVTEESGRLSASSIEWRCHPPPTDKGKALETLEDTQRAVRINAGMTAMLMSVMREFIARSPDDVKAALHEQSERLLPASLQSDLPDGYLDGMQRAAERLGLT